MHLSLQICHSEFGHFGNHPMLQMTNLQCTNRISVLSVSSVVKPSSQTRNLPAAAACRRGRVPTSKTPTNLSQWSRWFGIEQPGAGGQVGRVGGQPGEKNLRFGLRPLADVGRHRDRRPGILGLVDHRVDSVSVSPGRTRPWNTHFENLASTTSSLKR